MFFKNRAEAGKKLAEKLKKFKKDKNLIVLGLPRGGVPVAATIARTLKAPLEVIICRKIGAPGNEEFAIGAISESNGKFLNHKLITTLGVNTKYIECTIKKEHEKIRTYQEAFRSRKPLPNLKQKIVILVDDGAATGMTLKAAIDAVQKNHAEKIILALPVAPPDTAHELKNLVDECIILETPVMFQAVGQFYENFQQVETNEVQSLLKKHPY